MFVLVNVFSFKFCMDLLACVLYCFPLLNYSLSGLLKVAVIFSQAFSGKFSGALLAVVLVGI